MGTGCVFNIQNGKINSAIHLGNVFIKYQVEINKVTVRSKKLSIKGIGLVAARFLKQPSQHI
jgi:hypothetical protein